MEEEFLTVEEGLLNSLSLITTVGSDLSESEHTEIIKKAYISSLAVKDFIAGELDLNSFLDIQEYCLIESSIEDYLDIVAFNIENLSFSELFTS
jgi:hypothetical protein